MNPRDIAGNPRDIAGNPRDIAGNAEEREEEGLGERVGFCLFLSFEMVRDILGNRLLLYFLHKSLVRLYKGYQMLSQLLTLNFLVAVVNMLNSSKEMSELSFENADVNSICYCKQRMKSKLSLFLRLCRNEAL